MRIVASIVVTEELRFIDTGDEPLLHAGARKPACCVWALGEEGGKVLVSLCTTNRESYARWVEGLRGLAKRGRRTPVTLTSDGALGLTKAIATRGPKALRIRGWCHKRQNFQQRVPARAWPEGKAWLVDRREAPTREKAEQRREAPTRSDWAAENSRQQCDNL